jgi:hypothetical protein
MIESESFHGTQRGRRRHAATPTPLSLTRALTKKIVFFLNPSRRLAAACWLARLLKSSLNQAMKININKGGRRGCCCCCTLPAVTFLFLVLAPQFRAELASVRSQSWPTQNVFTDLAIRQSNLWLDIMASKSHSAAPRRHTDPTGVYSPVPALAGHQVSKRDLPFVYQSPPTVPCRNAASTSIVSGAKAVDFASFALGILTLVLNINNNINNNNNNNNNINLNAVDSSNIVANFNTNNANQVNIMPPGGRRRRSVSGSSALVIVALLQVYHQN